MRAGGDLVQGHLDQAAAHLAVAETYAETALPDRQRRLWVAIAPLKLSLAGAAVTWPTFSSRSDSLTRR